MIGVLVGVLGAVVGFALWIGGQALGWRTDTAAFVCGGGGMWLAFMGIGLASALNDPKEGPR